MKVPNAATVVPVPAPSPLPGAVQIPPRTEANPKKGPGLGGGCPMGAGSAPATPARVLWVCGGGFGQQPKDLGLPRIRRWGKIRPGPKILLGQPRGAPMTPPLAPFMEPPSPLGPSNPDAMGAVPVLLMQDRAPAQGWELGGGGTHLGAKILLGGGLLCREWGSEGVNATQEGSGQSLWGDFGEGRLRGGVLSPVGSP